MGRALAWMLALSVSIVAAAAQAAPCVDPARALTARAVDASLALNARFLLANQRTEGNFYYAYDWKSARDADDDSAVRQAGAAWGLALVLHAGVTSDARPALERALTFFARHSRVAADGARHVVYPGDAEGSLGTVALVALAHIEHQKSAGAVTGAQRDALDGYLRFIQRARHAGGGFHARYRHRDGAPFGDANPYYDGEALLALVKAARYLARVDLLPMVLEHAHADHRRNVEQARAADADSPITKGYYQWASLAYHELATWTETQADTRHGDRLLALADWMIDVHRTLERNRNTAYAYEGIVVAHALASARGDSARVRKLACTIERGLGRLMSWQVAGPTALAALRHSDDPRAIGGVQNHAREPSLRIDVTQHQAHALILARRHYLRP
jgi:UDP-N-acetylmuramoyl-tripeptide--D-alanyl-D-alanine ligase